MTIPDAMIERVATAIGKADDWSLTDNSPDYRAHLPAWKDYERQTKAALDAAGIADMLDCLLDGAEILFHLSTAGKNPSQDESIEAVRERMLVAIAKAEAAA